MQIKAIFSECSMDFWLDVTEKLVQENNWKPCYWIGMQELKQSIKERFPDENFHYSMNAARGKFAPKSI